MANIPDNPERVARDTDAALDRNSESVSLLARSRLSRGLPLSEPLLASVPHLAVALSKGNA